MIAIKNTSACIIWKFDADDKKRWNLKSDYMASAVVRGRKLAQARDKINAKYQDGTRTEIRNAE